MPLAGRSIDLPKRSHSAQSTIPISCSGKAVTESNQLVHPVPYLLSLKWIFAKDHRLDDVFHDPLVATYHVALGTIIRRNLCDRLSRVSRFIPPTVTPLRRVVLRGRSKADYFDIRDLHDVFQSLVYEPCVTIESHFGVRSRWHHNHGCGRFIRQ